MMNKARSELENLKWHYKVKTRQYHSFLQNHKKEAHPL